MGSSVTDKDSKLTEIVAVIIDACLVILTIAITRPPSRWQSLCWMRCVANPGQEPSGATNPKNHLMEILCAGIWTLCKKLSLVFSNLYWLLLPNRNGVVKPSSGYGEGEIMA